MNSNGNHAIILGMMTTRFGLLGLISSTRREFLGCGVCEQRSLPIPIPYAKILNFTNLNDVTICVLGLTALDVLSSIRHIILFDMKLSLYSRLLPRVFVCHEVFFI